MDGAEDALRDIAAALVEARNERDDVLAGIAAQFQVRASHGIQGCLRAAHQ